MPQVLQDRRAVSVLDVDAAMRNYTRTSYLTRARVATLNTGAHDLPVGILTDLKYTRAEKKFLLENEVCRIATCYNDVPHVVPVSYLFLNDEIYFATDYGTLKFKNLQRNNRIAAVVDVYGSVENKAICVQGKTDVIEHGHQFQTLYKIFHKKFQWVRDDPWTEGEAPFVKIVGVNKVSWGLENS